MSLQKILAVALGAALGGNLRYLISTTAVAFLGSAFPYATLFINVVGSFAIGFLMTRYAMREEARLFLVTGVLGGFTTYSSFSLECQQLAAAGQRGLFALYLGLTVGLGLLAVFLGAFLGSR